MHVFNAHVFVFKAIDDRVIMAYKTYGQVVYLMSVRCADIWVQYNVDLVDHS
jgi:hypothetical protein